MTEAERLAALSAPKEYATYEEARRAGILYARAAVASGLDPASAEIGLDFLKYTQVWTLHALPRRENRYGWELRCEVVKASDAL